MRAEAAYTCLDVCVHRPRGMTREQPVITRALMKTKTQLHP